MPAPSSTEENQKTPEKVMQEIASAYRVSQTIYVATKLGIADLLKKDEAKHCDELAAATNTHSDSLYRLLRALASWGIFAETQPRCFQLTPLAACLQRGDRGEIKADILWEEEVFQTFGNLLHSVKTGESAFENLYGMSFWEYCKQNSSLSQIFNGLMLQITESQKSAIVEAYDFSSINKLVDVGGGLGGLIAEILTKNSLTNGVLFEQQELVDTARNFLDGEGLSDRCEIIGGDFFTEIPAGGDAYILKRIIHDWDDKQAIKLLQSCYRAMTEKSKLLVIETIVSPINASLHETTMDVWMLLFFAGARERTEDEYRNLLKSAGLKLTKIIPTKSSASIIEAIKD